MDAASLFAEISLVPVVVLDDAAVALPLARTLYDNGIRALEITLRTQAALAAIESVAKSMPEMLVGAGSIRRVDQLASVRSAGGQFLVSPGSSPALLTAVRGLNLPFVPGAVTATEMLTLYEQGYQLLKFFPAELSGGPAKIEALSQPLPEIRFFPTGGINAALAPTYLALPSVSCIGGSWFVPSTSLAQADFSRIGELTAAAVALTDG